MDEPEVPEPPTPRREPAASSAGSLGHGMHLEARPPIESAIDVDFDVDVEGLASVEEIEEIEPEDDEDDAPDTVRRPLAADAPPKRLRTPTLVLTGEVRRAALPFEPAPRAPVETLVDVEEVKREALPFEPSRGDAKVRSPIGRETLAFISPPSAAPLPFAPATKVGPVGPDPAIEDRPRPARRRTETLVAEGPAAEPALPFSSAPIAIATTPISRPTIGSELAGTTSAPPSLARAEEPAMELAVYAAIRIAMWAGRAPLGEILARHGVDEADFRAHERRQASALEGEARAGRFDLVRALEGALDAALEGPPHTGDPPCPLDVFVTLQVEIERAAHPSAALAATGVTPSSWRHMRRHWRERAASDAELAREIRARLREARRALLGSAAGVP